MNNNLLNELILWIDNEPELTRKKIKTKLHQLQEIERLNEKFNFKKEMITLGFDNQLITEWISVRKTKRLTNTKTALEKFIKEVEKTKTDKNIILKMCVENSWGGFKSDWFFNEKKLNNNSNQNKDGRQQPLLGRQSADTVRANASGWNDTQ